MNSESLREQVAATAAMRGVRRPKEKARRILNEELDKLGWTTAELAKRAKGDVCKVRMARRLRDKTAATLRWIATELHMGTWTHVSNLLSGRNQIELNLCQK